MQVKEFEDNRWKNKEQAMVFRHKAALEMIEGGKVLDLGSGDGLILEELKKKGIQGQGLDISETAVKMCRERGLLADVIDFTAQKLPYNDCEFDYVLLLDVLEHVYQPEQILAEAVRVSKKNIIISVPNFNSLPARLQALIGRVPENNKPSKGHIYWFNLKILNSLLKKNNLEIESLRFNTFWEEKLLLNFATKALVKIFSQLFAISFVIKAHRKIV